MTIEVIAGSKFYIGGQVSAKTAIVLADFTGQTWTEISYLTKLSGALVEFGMASQEVIDKAVTVYRKTISSFPVAENMVLKENSDAGQAAFFAAASLRSPYAFKIEWEAGIASVSVVTITSASPGVVTWNAHGLVAGQLVTFATTGALPTGLTPGTNYYVIASGLTTNAFSVSATLGGAAVNTSSAGSGIHTATAQAIGNTELFFGYPMPSGNAGGAASDFGQVAISVQPIAPPVTI